MVYMDSIGMAHWSLDTFVAPYIWGIGRKTREYKRDGMRDS